jgi:hypothetical protein
VQRVGFPHAEIRFVSDPLGSWVLVARGLPDSPQASHGRSAGVRRSEVNRQTDLFSWGATGGSG